MFEELSIEISKRKIIYEGSSINYRSYLVFYVLKVNEKSKA